MFSKDRDFVLTENETLMFKRNRRTPTISDINIHLYMWLSDVHVAVVVLSTRMSNIIHLHCQN